MVFLSPAVRAVLGEVIVLHYNHNNDVVPIAVCHKHQLLSLQTKDF